MSTPVPVLLIPGWSADVSILAKMRTRLVEAGWPDDRVLALGFDDSAGSNWDHAREIAAAVDAMLARAGTEVVDIVAHSMGGLATRLYLMNQGGTVQVRRVVFMATPHRGTYAAYLTHDPGRREMMPGSDFLRALNQGPPVPPGVEAMTLRTRLDLHVLPRSSATLPGIPDVRICCSTHPGLAASKRAFRLILGFLQDGKTAATQELRA